MGRKAIGCGICMMVAGVLLIALGLLVGIGGKAMLNTKLKETLVRTEAKPDDEEYVIYLY